MFIDFVCKIETGDTTVMFDGYFDTTMSTNLFDNTFDYPATRNSIGFHMNVNDGDINEPPLLEELEIYPREIWDKAMFMVNPFAEEFAVGRFLIDADLSGPLFFVFLFGTLLFLAGKGFIFGNAL